MQLQGSFIVLDGPDGCGKSTQAGLLVELLRASGEAVQHVRDPGGTRLGESLRSLLLEGGGLGGKSAPELPARTELMLFFASRLQLAHERIRPAQEHGEVVVCERWISSSYAYQACACGEDPELVVHLGEVLLPDLFPPTRTLILDLDAGIALERAQRAAGAADRIEGRGVEYHERVRRGFLEYASRYSAVVDLIDASARSAAQVHEEIASILGL